MKFSAKAWSQGGAARAGVLQVGGFSTETPALLLHTRKGLPAFITPDLLSDLPTPDSRLLQFSPLHLYAFIYPFLVLSVILEFYSGFHFRSFSTLVSTSDLYAADKLSPSHACVRVCVSSWEGISLKTISDLGGLHKMVGLDEHAFVAVPRDSVISLPDYQSTNKIGASFETPSGRLLMKPMQYVEMISSMKPNMWATLADEVPTWVSQKRNRASVDRTVRWLDDCLKSAFTNNTGGAVFGSIVGGSNIEERKRCAQEVAKRNVSGFYLGGFGVGESMDERPSVLSAITRLPALDIVSWFYCKYYDQKFDVEELIEKVKEILPEDKPRQICGLGLPEEVLQGVAAGVDLFDSTKKTETNSGMHDRYIYHLTLGAFALTFPLEENGRHNSYVDQLCDAGNDGTKINLRATIYRKDMSPILDGCKCYTCQNHTKAYINHLFNVHEMLAHILLEIHNTHHYLGFFRAIREAIKRGAFEEFHLNFVRNRRDHILDTAFNS
ncbi:queuine tRNA-ribosyltransferase [Striga asiatica]|uniref:Queuine tRNA-ribosyltransferase accessory subunit 2 n=1 Tax=Striga asiatica TaxID=4170 RepID=A0A5A7PPF0_STRAF|nr:queuine tRNA-ribosyltransferase [Striga asiatica]